MALTDAELAVLNRIMYSDNHMSQLKARGGTASVKEVCSSIYSTAKDDAKFNRVSDIIANDNTGGFENLTFMESGTDVSGGSYAVFQDNDGQAYLIFQGTGSKEWGDNFEGLYETDTIQQEAAAKILNRMAKKYNQQLVVSGHSKGANKAMYCALTTDKVKRCVGFDGQGYGNAFIEKYADEIAERSDLITNHCVEGDFVNCLLHPVGNTVYHQSDKLEGDWVNNHADVTAMIEDDGSFTKEGLQTPLSREINKFTCWVDENAPYEDKVRIARCIGDITHIFTVYGGKENADKRERLLKEYLKNHPDDIALILAYFEEYGETPELIKRLLIEYFGTDLTSKTDTGTDQLIFAASDFFIELMLFFITLYAASHPTKMAILGSALAELLKALIAGFCKSYGLGEDYLDKIIASSKKDRKRIRARIKDRKSKKGLSAHSAIHDFSDEKLEQLVGLIHEIEDESWYDISKWDVNYRAERVFGRLNISNYQNNINTYYRKTLDISGMSEGEVRKIFSKARARDDSFSNEIDGIAREVSASVSLINSFEFGV